MPYFELRIESPIRPDEYQVKARVVGPGWALPYVFEKAEFNMASIEKDFSAIRKREAWIDLQEMDSKCRTIGFLLFQTFFRGNIGRRYSDYVRSLVDQPDNLMEPMVRLFLPEGLHECPWELLRTELLPNTREHRDFRLYIARRGIIVRYSSEARLSLNPPKLPHPLPLLWIVASPGRDIPRPDPPSNPNVIWVPIRPGRTFESFNEHILRTKGFLFHGHAELTKDKGVVLNFEDSAGRTNQVPAGRVASKTQNARTQLVVLSACRTASFSESDFAETAVGQLLFDGYPALAIAYQAEIDVLAGEAFVNVFFENLYSHSLLQCVNAARTAILDLAGAAADDDARIAIDRASRDWWVPVLYATTSNPDLVFQKPNDPALERLGQI